MIDETGSATPPGTTASPTQDAGQHNPQNTQSTQNAQDAQNVVVAFCQQCGRALTGFSQRRVGAGIFCEPCATMRAAQPAGWNAGNATAATAANQEPNPVLAGFLGLIPGVGAMYNGQYAKGVIHLIVFTVLVSLADNIYWVLWWFVWGWIFYQGFEAYHTAQARRDGQPLPDPFGWNELGDRLGFSRHWPPPVGGTAPVRPPAAPFDSRAPQVPQTPYEPSTPRPYTADPYQPIAPVPPLQSIDFTATSPVPPTPGTPNVTAGSSNPNSPYPGTTFHAGAFTQVPFQSTYVGGGPTPVPGQPVLVVGARRFPVGAAWLIGLGVLFLLGNVMPNWHMEGRWLVPILLAAIAFWTGGTRLAGLHEARSTAGFEGDVPATAGALVLPGILLTLAVLLALQNADVLPLRHSWPALLIVWGALIFVQRAAAPEPVLAVPPPPDPTPASPVADVSAP